MDILMGLVWDMRHREESKRSLSLSPRKWKDYVLEEQIGDYLDGKIQASGLGVFSLRCVCWTIFQEDEITFSFSLYVRNMYCASLET